jgi:phosphatidate phosphatase LPIN
LQQYFKALRPTSDQLKTLNLKPGVNTIKFSVSSSFVSARLFLWNWDDKIVISDIDGTITKSDVLGHLFNVIGKDWTHSVSRNF